MARTGSPATRHVAAVERAVAVLDALVGGELGTNEVARRTGLNASTASRQLATLVAAGLVAHVEETGRYRLGPRLVELGNAALAGLDVRDLARPHLRALSHATGETATLSVPGDPDAITVDFVQSPSSVQSVARLGRPSVAHATATGKVALAFGEVELPPGRLRPYTARTITDRAALAREIAVVRERGYAVALREREDDLNAVAAPVCDSRGDLVAVIGVQGPASRFTPAAIDASLPVLRERAAAVSGAIGGDGAEP
ncbi:Transcriptional regulator [Gaiella occulta]|uniref:Transcriptional regulator n=1 Tax=Gaiella occulta TaxID=1002870 RepID=A0A7M2Z1W0_9ACTN|nr:IclR family transcriptional regulator [Gaiella occulta]RDI76119.1 Transcriptional regulator [Gaiella occulta]